MSYNAYDTQKCKGWIQRCEKEVASQENFWKNEMIRSRKKAEMADDASSVVSSYASGRTTSTVNTIALKDKIKTLESKLEVERTRRETLEKEMKTLKP